MTDKVCGTCRYFSKITEVDGIRTGYCMARGTDSNTVNHYGCWRWVEGEDKRKPTQPVAQLVVERREVVVKKTCGNCRYFSSNSCTLWSAGGNSRKESACWRWEKPIENRVIYPDPKDCPYCKGKKVYCFFCDKLTIKLLNPEKKKDQKSTVTELVRIAQKAMEEDK